KRLASIGARIDAVGALMKVADSPMRRLEAFRLLEDLSLDVHDFYRELINDFRCKWEDLNDCRCSAYLLRPSQFRVPHRRSKAINNPSRFSCNGPRRNG